MSKLQFDYKPTSNLCEKIKIQIKPKLVILNALGGFTNGSLDDAEKVQAALTKFCNDNNVVIVPNIDGKTIDFVHKDDLPTLIKQLEN